ncbi:LysM peptidoglycan-binding domain-containing protein [Vallitalea sp.]|jgi:LysM repeat protein|uniref:LysM peptidoglycan-binding domain-containing protein n=1 Tax=Vallitalea sp. TaxID=1882829 RepID=UPI0025EEA190|nr:LysM peptidoglycan-binding domain-containing protein [Vallitalea sp.]MCT4688130.1 LysM peptidoglycan-binding domain-containing protein [Vallitalea sp.]
MNFNNNYRLIKQDNGEYTLILYLDSIDTEFADEYGQINIKKKNQFYDAIRDYINTQFPKLKINLCKVMLGTMLIASVPLMNNTNVSAATTSTTYKVVSGDTLWKISKKYDTTVDALKSLNNLKSDVIYVNQDLLIPRGGATYKVVAGDTLYKISKAYGTTVNNLKKLNNLSSDVIYIGQTLKINGVSSNTTTGTIDTPSATPTVSYITHSVQSGENIWTISIKYGIPQTELMKVNNYNENTMLSIGQRVKVPVHNIPVKSTVSTKHGEYLDWFLEAQYVFPINETAKITDFHTGKTFNIKRTIGANHADCEPLTANDTAIAKGIWGGYSWVVRPVIVEIDGRKVAASMSFMPHSIQYITNNNFTGHFDIHFLNSTRHKDGLINDEHQKQIKIAAGISSI